MRLYIVLLSISLFLSCKYEKIEPTPVISSNPCDTATITYTNRVKIIIDNNCALSGCHIQGFAAGDFTTYNGIKTKVDLGVFEDRVIIKKDMPLSGPLPDSLIAILKNWLQQGACE